MAPYQIVSIYTRLYPTILDCILLYQTVSYSTRLYPTLLDCTLLYQTVSYLTSLYPTLLDCILLYQTLSYSTRLYPSLLECILLYQIVSNYTRLYPTLLDCIPVYQTVSYSTTRLYPSPAIVSCSLYPIVCCGPALVSKLSCLAFFPLCPGQLVNPRTLGPTSHLVISPPTTRQVPNPPFYHLRGIQATWFVKKKARENQKWREDQHRVNYQAVFSIRISKDVKKRPPCDKCVAPPEIILQKAFITPS